MNSDGLDSEQWWTTAIGSLIFSWMLYKLFRVVMDFRQENLSVRRAQKDEETRKNNLDVLETHAIKDELEPSSDFPERLYSDDLRNVNAGPSAPRADSEQNEVESEHLHLQDHLRQLQKIPKSPQGLEMDEEDDTWEGLESSDLEEEFNAAATYIATMNPAISKTLEKETQLRLYAFYKQSTHGTNDSSEPSVLNFTLHAKWNAWKGLGEMSAEQAMASYVNLVSSIMQPNGMTAQSLWDTEEPSACKQAGDARLGESAVGGPVFSTLMENEDASQEGQLVGLQACASLGDVQGLQSLLQTGFSVNGKDEEGRTALHWAADRGHLEALNLLLHSGADVNVADAEGQTPLHYAVWCEHEQLAQVLLGAGADMDASDIDGASPASLWPSTWTWGVPT